MRRWMLVGIPEFGNLGQESAKSISNRSCQGRQVGCAVPAPVLQSPGVYPRGTRVQREGMAPCLWIHQAAPHTNHEPQELGETWTVNSGSKLHFQGMELMLSRQ